MSQSEIFAKKVAEDEEFRSEFLAVKAASEEAGKSAQEFAQALMPLVEKAGIEMNLDDLVAHITASEVVELDDDAADAVSGGGCGGVHGHGGTCVECPTNCCC